MSFMHVSDSGIMGKSLGSTSRTQPPTAALSAAGAAQRRVIEASGGKLIERFHKPAAYGGAESLRFRILL
jgi:hypothetical protein